MGRERATQNSNGFAEGNFGVDQTCTHNGCHTSKDDPISTPFQYSYLDDDPLRFLGASYPYM